MANWMRVTDTEILGGPCEHGSAVPIVLVSGSSRDMGEGDAHSLSVSDSV